MIGSLCACCEDCNPDLSPYSGFTKFSLYEAHWGDPVRPDYYFYACAPSFDALSNPPTYMDFTLKMLYNLEIYRDYILVPRGTFNVRDDYISTLFRDGSIFSVSLFDSLVSGGFIIVG